jgi:hypothetical protein
MNIPKHRLELPLEAEPARNKNAGTVPGFCLSLSFVGPRHVESCALWWQTVGGILLAVSQREVGSFGPAELSVCTFGVDLSEDRCVERHVGCCPFGRRPKARDLHHF